MSTNRILIPLDGSDFSSRILSRVQRLFRPEENELILLRVSPLPEGLSAPPPRVFVAGTLTVSEYMSARHVEMARHPIERSHTLVNVEAALQDELRGYARPLESAGYKVVTLVRFGEPAAEIAAAAEEEGVDLVAMATHGRSGIGRLVMGSVAEGVLRRLTIPVLLVRPIQESALSLASGATLARRLAEAKPLRLAVATDGSPHSLLAAQGAFDLAAALQAEVTLLMVASSDGVAARIREALRLDKEAPSEIVPLTGFNYRRLLDRLEGEPIDLLVVGPFADRTATPPFSVGLTVRRLAQFAHMPVLVVKGESASFGRILACTAIGDDQIVEASARLAKALGAEFRLLHVVPLSDEEHAGAEAGVTLPLESVLAGESTQADFLRVTLGRLKELGFDERALEVRCGRVPEAIIEAAREAGHDLIVVGKSSRPDFFLGSIADEVLRYAPRSVLVL